MGTSTNTMVRIVSSLIVLGAVARSAPNPIVPKKAALDFMKGASIVNDEEELPEIPEDVPVPNCSPSAALLKVGNWMYVPNQGKSNTADVWFTVLSPMVPYAAAKAGCAALDKNMQIASIMSSTENKAIQNLHGGGSKEHAKTWTGGYLDASTSQFKWLYGGKNTNEVMTYTSWDTEQGYPSYDPSAVTRTDLRKTSNNWKDSEPEAERPTLCM